MTIVLVEGRPGGANHDSRSPFFSLFSLTYSKAIISSYFHYQTAGAAKSLKSERFRRDFLTVLPGHHDPAAEPLAA